MDIKTKLQNHSNAITGPCKEYGRNDVFCDSFSSCEKCGWNYDVEAKRKSAIREKLKEEANVRRR